MSLRGNRTVAILREVKNKWERRAPLTPRHVRQLVDQDIRVLVQPSGRRVFSDEEYRRAGAEMGEDVSAASLVLGVKEVPPEQLLPNRTYGFFSHVIKAQPYNMPLLDALVDKNIRMMDYECIVRGGQRGGSRLVAFGRYAGLAGMVDTMRGLGERLLSLGMSTPFLNVSNTFMYRDLDAARRAVRECGEAIADLGTPAEHGPMTFMFTGAGKVSKGAQEMFQQLPHEYVKVEDLPHLMAPGNADLKLVYGVEATAKDMVARRDGGAFEAAHYYANPDLYEPVFHERVAPYTSVLMNCMYWDAKFPRLLTKQQTEDLARAGRLRMLALGDVSCDVGGSVEFFSHSTEIDDPFYLYDPEAHMVHHNMDDHGILVEGIENLPSQLPRDASESFGDALVDFIPALASSDGTLPHDRQAGQLPPEVHGAFITSHGALTPNFRYIQELRRDTERLAARESGGVAHGGHKRLLLLRGHLFDYSLINRVLDLVESSPCEFKLSNCVVGSARDEPTQAVMELTGDEATLADVEKRIRVLADNMGEVAHTTLRSLPHGALEGAELGGKAFGERVAMGGGGDAAAEDPAARLPASVRDMGRKRVLVLGSGLVSGPLLDYLHRVPELQVTVASADEEEARLRAGGRERIVPRRLDVTEEVDKLAAMVGEHDLSISLVPAAFHARVAKACIAAGKHLVTASYVSPEMRALSRDAERAGVSVLCELGLDPGIDHMSAKRLVDVAHDAGGAVESFESLCGGLPAPEAASNPLGYKFSWSPRGVLLAGKNAARFLAGGQEVRVPADALFRAAKPIDILPSLSIEHLPNRDSVPYGDAYGIPEAHTVYRGTLRYRGFADIMHNLRELGLLEEEAPLCGSWGEFLRSRAKPGAGSAREALRQRLDFTEASPEAARRVLDALDWLGLLRDDSPMSASAPGPLDALCSQLLTKLQYGPEERDMVLMHHRVGVRRADGARELHKSTLLAYGVPGGDSAMSTTVGLPAAVGATLLLDGTIRRRGVMIPVDREVYSPIMGELEKEGIVMQETCEAIE